MSPKKDWEMGIDPSPAELTAQVVRVRGYLQECRDLVDELFPEGEDDRKVQPDVPAPFRMFPFGGFIPPERQVVVSDE